MKHFLNGFLRRYVVLTTVSTTLCRPLGTAWKNRLKKQRLPIGKLLLIPFFILQFLTSCQPSLDVQISNPSERVRTNEMVEVDLDTIQEGLNLSDRNSFIVQNEHGKTVPYQITHDNKVIFQTTVAPRGKTTFKIRPGKPEAFDVKVCGRLYPERLDDLAWENDLVGFRAYGPALQKSGERGFGYDLFAKRGTNKPVLEGMYARATNDSLLAHLRELQKTDPKAARKFRREITYHVDRGYGMDCYAVGPTLGAGVAALLEDGQIVYPWCYQTCEILDNGPLRFTVRLVFPPLTYKGKDIVETREISLDAGSHMNRTTVSYQNIQEEAPVVVGIVLHDENKAITASTAKRIIAYQDPTTGRNQGQLFVGHVYTEPVKDTRIVYFSKEEMKMRNYARGYVLAENVYAPGSELIYYWGFGWNRSDVKNFTEWNEYLEFFAERLKEPLRVTLD